MIFHNIKTRLHHFPVSAYAIILGMTGFVIALHKFETVFKLPFHLSFPLLLLDSAVFTVITVSYLGKLLLHPGTLQNDLHHPVRSSFIPAFSISLLLLSIGWLEFSPGFSRLLWLIGTPVHLILTLKTVSFWIRHPQIEIHSMTPAWFIPVVGFLLVPVAGTAHYPADLSLPFFTIGSFFWVALSAVFFNRVFFHRPLQEKLLPTLFILIAPPSVGVISLFRLTGALHPVAKGLYGLALFFLLLMLFLIKIFTGIKFYLSWWAYSFPLAALSIASLLLYQQTGVLFYAAAGITVFSFLALLLVYLTFRTVQAVRRHEICVEEA